MGEPLVMVAGPLVVVALVVVVCFVVADRLAEQEFFRSFARARGFTYALRMELLPLTPLLGAGDRRECRHWMQGPLGEGLPACGLGHYFFKVRHGTGEGESLDHARLHDLRCRPRARDRHVPGRVPHAPP